MIDSETESLWSHLLGKAMDCELKDTVLETIPSTMVEWQTWRADHPDTTVLALKRTSRKFVREFHQDAGRFVLGLHSLSKAKSYGFDELTANPVINDTFDGEPVVVVYRPKSAGGRAFIRKATDEVLQFETVNEGTRMKDIGTGAAWNPETGRCEKGKLKGTQLQEIPAIVSFYKAWHVFYPDSDRFSR